MGNSEMKMHAPLDVDYGKMDPLADYNLQLQKLYAHLSTKELTFRRDAIEAVLRGRVDTVGKICGWIGRAAHLVAVCRPDGNYSFCIGYRGKVYDINNGSGKDKDGQWVPHSWWPWKSRFDENEKRLPIRKEDNQASYFVPNGFLEVADNVWAFDGSQVEAILRLRAHEAIILEDDDSPWQKLYKNHPVVKAARYAKKKQKELVRESEALYY